MKRYFPQETPFSCGASAVRNILKQFNIVKSEKYLRKLCNTNENGTETINIIKAIKSFNLNAIEHQTKSLRRFLCLLINGLKENKKFIISVDNNQHWICAIQYYNKKVKIVDSDFLIERKILAPELNSKQLISMAYNYDKFNDKKYFHFIEVYGN